MPELMHTVITAEAPPREDFLVELPSHSRLPRLDLGIDWGSPREELWSSLLSFFSGPRPAKESELASARALRVDWVRGRLPGRAFLASSLWHVVIVWALILPIWGFLPENTPTLTPVQIELTWYGEPADLPPIELPAPTPKPVKKPDAPAKPPTERGADAFHPRQTIVSIPVHVTHPRQTLIRPDAPPAPPKIVTPLPNIVQWAAVQSQRPHLRLSPSDSAPLLRKRAVRDVEAPELANLERNAGPLNLAPAPVTIQRPRMILEPMSMATAQRRAAHVEEAAAPEIGAAADAGDSSMRRLIALSAAPAPPAPSITVPDGNLAARISISPEGAKPGAAGPSVKSEPGSGGTAASSSGAIGTGGIATAANSLPAAVSISGAAGRGGGGGIAAAGIRPGGLILKPLAPYDPSINARRGPANVAAMDPSLPPEKILSGKEVYTLHVNLPNLTSASGSWILNFAELDEEDGPPYKRRDRISGPVAVEKADPKYPPELIKGHVRGEVVLYAIIRKDGSVDSIQVVRSLDPQLDRNAADALAQWKFEPGLRAGVPVDLEAVVHVPFTYIDPKGYGSR
ncbi:MAG TPA: TonB family protein [Candidatus Acidoferrales bacterium]|nr:TonB family protein [Candidatus Acidoferrales bacterium]